MNDKDEEIREELGKLDEEIDKGLSVMDFLNRLIRIVDDKEEEQNVL